MKTTKKQALSRLLCRFDLFSGFVMALIRPSVCRRKIEPDRGRAVLPARFRGAGGFQIQEFSNQTGIKGPRLGRRAGANSKKTGFTLLETLAAVLLLAGLAALVSQISYGNFQRIKKSRRINRAAFLLEQKMSELEAEYKNSGNIAALPSEAEGEFEDEKEFSWSYKTRPLELPGALAMLALQGIPQSDINIRLAGMMKDIARQIVLELELKATWKKGGRQADYSLVSYFVDYGKASGHIQSAVAGFSPAGLLGEAAGGADGAGEAPP